jgi:hypothetical protein
MMTLSSLLRDRFTQTLVAIYLLLAGITLLAVLHKTGHHFSYALDDPYIHLALAEGIQRGVYGINAGETSSPASSVIWPFLLVPFMHRSFSQWVPLVFNIIFSLGTCLLLGQYLRRYYLDLSPRLSRLASILLAFLLIVAANLIGLTFIGMEHTLQIMLVTGCALGLMEAYAGRPIPVWTMAMAALAPAVRYEDLAITLAVTLACVFTRRYLAALLTFGLSLAPLIGLGIFLHSHGLAFFPNSVLLKGGIGQTGSHFLTQRLPKMLFDNLILYLISPDRLPITLLTVGLGAMLRRKRTHPLRRNILRAILLTCLLLIFLGPYGWLHRYDVGLRLFALLSLLGVLGVEKLLRPSAALGLALLGALVYLPAPYETPIATREIYLQQVQMDRFASTMWRQNIAVHDIGRVAYGADRAYYVLDLFGLDSPEALKATKTTAWLDDITRRHRVTLVMIYPIWLPPAPASWTPVAELHLKTRPAHVAVYKDFVVFYATSQTDLPALRNQLVDFSRTLPEGSWMTFPDANTKYTTLPEPALP